MNPEFTLSVSNLIKHKYSNSSQLGATTVDTEQESTLQNIMLTQTLVLVKAMAQNSQFVSVLTKRNLPLLLIRLALDEKVLAIDILCQIYITSCSELKQRLNQLMQQSMTVFAANLITSNINNSQQIKAKLSSNIQTSQVIFNAKIRDYYTQ